MFIYGFYIYVKGSSTILPFSENFATGSCPNILVRRGSELHLLNTKKAKIPGVNPIKFKNLEEYAEYMDWANNVGIKCPILYLQETYNTQNQRGVRLLNDPLDPKAGLSSHPKPFRSPQPEELLKDANRDDKPYNQNMFAGFDPDDQYIGSITPLDKIEPGRKPVSEMNRPWEINQYKMQT